MTAAVEWRDGGVRLRRAVDRRAGWDCRRRCQHEKKGEHGWHCDEWHYVVGDGRSALVLQVSAAEFADDPKLTAEWQRSSIRDSRFSKPHGIMVVTHLPFRALEEDVRSNDEGSECAYVEGGRCWTDGGRYTLAEEVFAKHGDRRGREQPESFWLELERLFGEIVDYAVREYGHRARCPTCAGVGIVKVDG